MCLCVVEAGWCILHARDPTDKTKQNQKKNLKSHSAAGVSCRICWNGMRGECRIAAAGLAPSLLPACQADETFFCARVWSECVTVPGSDRSTQLHHRRRPPAASRLARKPERHGSHFIYLFLFCLVLPGKELQGHSSPVSSILSITYSHPCQNVRHACAAMRSLGLRRVFFFSPPALVRVVLIVLSHNYPRISGC